MYKVRVEIEGIVPMKQNRITERVVQEISGKGGKKQTPEEIENSYMEKCYVNKDGQYYIPSEQFQFCLNNGMVSPVPVKSNKVKMSKQKAKGTIFVQNNSVITNGGKKVEPAKDITAVSTKFGLTLQIRPIFKEGWRATFDLLVVQDWLTLDALKDGIIQAGTCHGVGSHRPTFGRFIVKDIKVVKQ